MKKIILGLMAFCFAVSANAGCVRNDLNGNWVAYSTGESMAAFQARFSITQKSNTAQVQGVSVRNTNQEIPATLTITNFTPDCSMQSNLTYSDGSGTYIAATMAKTKNEMIGLWFNLKQDGSLLNSGAFSAVKK